MRIASAPISAYRAADLACVHKSPGIRARLPAERMRVVLISYLSIGQAELSEVAKLKNVQACPESEECMAGRELR